MDLVGLRKAKVKPLNQRSDHSSSLVGRKVISTTAVHNNKCFRAILILLLLLFASCSKPTGSFQELMERGGELLSNGEKKKAYKYYKAALSINEGDSLVHYAASKAAPDQNSAYRHISTAWNKGLRTRGVLYDYIAYSFFTSLEKKKEFAFSLFEEMPAEIATNELKGELLYFLGEYDSALAVWHEAFYDNKNIETGKKLASAYAAKGQVDSVKKILLDPALKNVLDVRAQVMLASVYASSNEYDKVDSIFGNLKKASELKLPISLEELTFKFLAGDFNSTLSGILKIVKKNGDLGSLRDNILLLASVSSFYSGDSKKLSDIKNSVSVANNTLIDSVISQLLNKKYEDVLTILESIKDNKPNSLKDMLSSALYANQREDSLALEKILALPPLYKESFAMLPLFANIAMKIGRDTLALEILNRMHSKNYYTINSLKLERDIYISQSNFKRAKRIHLQLDKKFPNRSADPGLARIYTMVGKVELANREYLKLIKKYPAQCNIRIEFAKELFNRSEYKKCILILKDNACSKNLNSISIHAEALVRINKINEAENLFQSVKSSYKSRLDFIEAYSLFLYKIGKLKKAHEQYNGISAEKFNEILSENNNFSFVFINNYIWRKMASGIKPEEKDIQLIKRVYHNSNENKIFRNTYGAALRAGEQFADCLLLYKGFELSNLSNDEIFTIADCRFKLGYYDDAYQLFKSLDGKSVESVEMDTTKIASYITLKISQADRKRRKNVN